MNTGHKAYVEKRKVIGERLEYIESASLWFDIRILLMTLRAFKNAY